MNAKGQSWSIDLAVSLVLFTLAILIAYTMVSNSLAGGDYESVRVQAQAASTLLAAEGYPQHFTNDTVLRAGLAAADQFSLRKAAELGALTPNQFRQSVRVTDNVYVYVMNESGDVVSLFGTCGVGDLVVTPIPANETLRAAALANATAVISTNVSVTRYTNGSILDTLSRNDVLLIETNMSTITNMTAAEMVLRVHTATQRGMTIVVIGNPGVPLLGIRLNATNASTITIAGTAGAALNLNTNEVLNVSLLAQPLATIETVTAPEAANVQVVGLTDAGKIAYATWTYNDARVWYLATAQGLRASTAPLNQTLMRAVQGMINVSRPQCTEPLVPSTAMQVASYDRVLAHHDHLLTVRTIVWRQR